MSRCSIGARTAPKGLSRKNTLSLASPNQVHTEMERDLGHEQWRKRSLSSSAAGPQGKRQAARTSIVEWTTGEAATIEKDGLITRLPAGTEDQCQSQTYSAVDAWNPGAKQHTPKPIILTPMRERKVSSRIAKVPEVNGVATYGRIRVPLNNDDAFWRGYLDGDFIPITCGYEPADRFAVEIGEADKVAFGVASEGYGPYLTCIEELLIESGEKSPVLVDDTGIALHEHFSPTRKHIFRRRSIRPDGGQLNSQILASADAIPWMKPSILNAFEEVRYSDAVQPRTEKARDLDGLPVSPGRVPRIEEMNVRELQRVVAMSKRGPNARPLH